MRAVVLREGRLDVREVTGPGARGRAEAAAADAEHGDLRVGCALHGPPRNGYRRSDRDGRSYDADRDIVLGHEFVGEVIGHGPGCTEQFPVGTRVTSIPIRLVNGGADGVRIIGQHPEAQGSFGELVVVAEILAKPVDGDVSSDAAALTDAFAVGEFYVRSARMEPGEIPIVIGAGAIGLVRGRRARRPRHRADHRVRLQFRAPRTGVRPASARTSRSTRRSSRRSTSGVSCASSADMWGPMVVFECVGAAGLIQKIVDSVDIGTRIYCAGGWYTGDTLNITDATRQGVTIQFGGGPMPQDWYGTLDAIAAGRLDPMPSVGAVIGLDEVPDAIDSARKSKGPPRIIVHPNGDVT